MLKKALCAGLALFLGACSHTDDFQRPELPVPTQWPARADASGQDLQASLDWEHYFVDPRLHALIALALQNNRDLRIAVARVQEARAQYGIVGADRFPNLSLGASATAGATPPDLSGTGTELNGQRYDLALNTLSYEVDFWGRIAGLTEAARDRYLASEEARKVARLSLIADVAVAYFSLLQSEELLTLARATTAARAQSLDVVQKGRDIGAAYDFEVEEATGSLEAARSAQATLENQRDNAQNQLDYLIGNAAQSDLPQGLALDAQGLDTPLAAGLPSQVLLQRPDVIGAEQRLRAAHADIGAARAAFLPKVLLTAGAGVASAGLANLFNGSAWNFEPSITLPLFDAGKLSSGVDMAQARKVIAVAEYEKTIQVAFREVANLLSVRSSLALQARSAEIGERAQLRRLEIVRARHNAGLTGVLEVLDGERELLAARQLRVQLRRAQLEASAQLFKALGGGA